MHFKKEEELMDHHGYPEITEHKKQHNNSLGELFQVYKKFIENDRDFGCGPEHSVISAVKYLKANYCIKNYEPCLIFSYSLLQTEMPLL